MGEDGLVCDTKNVKNIWQELKKPFFVLAPMDDVTDTVFRRIIANCAAPDLYFTEFVSVDGLQSAGRDRLIEKLQFTPKEKPIIAQIWGLKPENYLKTAQEIVKMGFAGVDINMGCPEKSVVKNGCCSALILNRPLAKDIIQAVQQGAKGRIPVSVKCRTGLNEIDTSWHEFLLGLKLDAIVVHGRTTKNMSKVPNRWDVIDEIRKLRDDISPSTVFVGNGDVTNRQEAQMLAEKHQLDGVMMGRAVFSDPYAFSTSSPWPAMSSAKKIALFKKHVKLFADVWGDKRNPAVLKKFAKIYINGFDGASALRIKVMQQETIKGLLELVS